MKLTVKQTTIASLASMAMVLGLGIAFIPSVEGGMIMSRASGESVSNEVITFNGSSSQKSGTTNTTTGLTSTGSTIICKSFNNDSSQSSGLVGAVKSGSLIKFYEADGETEYTFEDLQIIRFYYSGTCGYNIHYVYSTGVSGTFSYTDSTATATGRGANFSDSTKYGDVSNITMECTTENNNVALISKIEITYNCSSKSETGISIATAPSKTSYYTGEKFDTTGMVVMVNYSNGTSVATTSYTCLPGGALSSSDTEVVISYHGFSVSQPITVSNTVITGTYSNSSSPSTYVIVLNNDGTGVYTYTNSNYPTYNAVQHFTWSRSGTTITFTNSKEAGDYKGSTGSFYYLFTDKGGSNYDSNTGRFYTDDGGYLSLNLCGNSSKSASAKRFDK